MRALVTIIAVLALAGPAVAAAPATPPLRDGTQLAGAGIGTSRFGRGRTYRPSYRPGYRRRGIGGHGFFFFGGGGGLGFLPLLLILLVLFLLFRRRR